MRVLILKLTSLGDVVHTLPAVTDACRARPDVVFDWAVDQSLAEIPAWHPGIDRTLALPMRSWRRTPWNALLRDELPGFIRQVQEEPYDLVIDAQGQHGKTIWIAYLAGGVRAGMDWHSIREPLASIHYQRKFAVPKKQHAVERVRQLFSLALDYPRPTEVGQCGIDREKQFQVTINPKRLVFLHGTSWKTKLWPMDYWSQLIRTAGRQGYEILMTWGDPVEKDRVMTLSRGHSCVVVHPKSGLNDFAREMASAAGVIGMDTGLGHLAAALGIPTVSLYGPTSTGLTGVYGPGQHSIASTFSCAPCFSRQCHYEGPSTVTPACFEEITPAKVWKALMGQLSAPA